MVTLHLANQLCSPIFIYLANLAVASILASCVSLLTCNLFHRAGLPLRHLLLLGGLAALLVSPLLIGVIQRAGFSLVGVIANSRLQPIETPHQPIRAASSSEFKAAVVLQHNPLGTTATTHGTDRQIAGGQPARPAQPKADLVMAERATAPRVSPLPNHSISSVVFWIALALGAVWLAGIFCQLYWLQKGLRGVDRLRRSIRPINDPQVYRIAYAAANVVGLRECPSFGQSPATDVPLAIGVLRGQVIVPWNRANIWCDQQWMSLLVHEMAHIARCDLLVGFLQRVCVAIYWWNPLVRRLSANISWIREQICDDLVVEHAGGAGSYAKLLVEFACRIADGETAASALGVADGSPSELRNRVRRLMEPRHAIVTSLSRWVISLGLAFGLALVLSPLAIAIHVNFSAAGEAAKRDGTRKRSDTAAKATPPEHADSPTTNHEMLKKPVRVVDTEGRPVAGATIKGFGIGIARPNGAGVPWRRHGFVDSDPPTVVTDADGKAIIPFPRYASEAEKLLTATLHVSVEHPEFAILEYAFLKVDGMGQPVLETLVLHRGAQIDFKAFDGEKPLPMDRVHLLCNVLRFTSGRARGIDTESVKLNANGWLESPRLPPPSAIVQLVYVPASGPVMFSEPKEMTLNDGETDSVRMQMKPATTVDGRLDASVPRPVTNGRVVSQVIQVSKNTRQLALGWRVSAEIKPDGSFQLPDVPPGELQVTALCDGYVAASGKPPDFDPQETTDRFSRPQVFSLTEKHAIIVKMTRTADCTIHVVGPDNRPVAGAECSFWPNVAWWGRWGSQIYCDPMYSSIDFLKGPAKPRDLETGDSSLYEATTNADGTATIKNLPPGDQSLSVTSDRLELPIGPAQWRWIGVALTAGKTAHVNARMQPKGSDFLGTTAVTISGRVVDPDGKPVADATVALANGHGNSLTGDMRFSYWTDKDGRFVSKLPASGTAQYNLVAHDGGDDKSGNLMWRKWANGTGPKMRTTPGQIIDGVELKLTRPATIRGRVVDAAGKPVARVEVTATPADNSENRSYVPTTKTDKNGRYELRFVSPGKQVIELDAWGAKRTVTVAAGATIENIDFK